MFAGFLYSGEYFARGRDNARTPMQWDNNENAGFTKGIPWIIALRRKYNIFIEGAYIPVLLEDANIFSYIRESDKEKLLIVANFYGNKIPYKMPEEFRTSGRTLIHNYGNTEEGFLQPYEAMIIYFQRNESAEKIR